MTDTLITTPSINSGTPTSGNDTSRPTLRKVRVRELRTGDIIAHAIGLAGRVEIARVTAELAPDLTKWWAVRLTGGTIIPAYDDSPDHPAPGLAPGRYRLRTASARGFMANHRALTIAEAELLITGAACFFHGEATPHHLSANTTSQRDSCR